MRSVTIGLAAAILLCWGAIAYPAVSGRPGAVDTQITIEGAGHATDRVRTGGTSVPLSRALEKIIPDSYSINMPNAGAWADVPVSWRGGQSFAQALREALAGHSDVTVTINTDLRLVTVRARQQPFGEPLPSAPAPQQRAQSIAALAKAAMAAEPTHPASTTASISAPPSASTAPVASAQQTQPALQQDATPKADPAPPAPTWRLDSSDRTIKTALSRWAKKAAWQLVWQVPVDFSIDADATIHGSFEDALRAVADALRKSQTPIQVILYKANKVVRVVPLGAG